jgi:hypothetical protein
MIALPAPATVSVCLPFAGFYCSLWSDALDHEESQTVEYWQEDRDSFDSQFPELSAIPAESIKWDSVTDAMMMASDYRKQREHIAREYVAEFGAWLAETLEGDFAQWHDCGFRFEELNSPRFYNFGTDRIFAQVPCVALQAIFARLTDNSEGRDLLAKTIAARFTSYDGFISFYSNSLADWLAKPFDDWDANELGTLIIAWGAFNDVDDFDELLFDYRCGGLYEEIYRAIDNSVDWQGLSARVIDAHAHLLTRGAAQ